MSGLSKARVKRIGRSRTVARPTPLVDVAQVPRGAKPLPPCRALERSQCALALLTDGYRGWMGGLRTGDVTAWESVFSRYVADLGLCNAKRTIDALSEWVTAIDTLSTRRVNVCPPGERRLCRDECMAVSMVAAAQADACPALRACAFALIGSSHVDPVVATTETLAGELRESDHLLAPSMIVAPDLLTLPPTAHAGQQMN